MTSFNQIRKKKDHLLQGDLNPRPLDLKTKTLPMSHQDLLEGKLQNSLVMSTPMIQFQPFLANFRQLPPTFTYIAPIQTFFPNFFHKINFPRQSEATSGFWCLAHIFDTPGPIFNIFAAKGYILCHILSIYLDMFVLLPNL